MYLTETYSRVQVSKNLSDMFLIRNGLKQRDALSPVFFNFALRVRHQEGSGKPGWLEIKWYTPASGNDVNILGGSVHTVKENAEALVVATKEIGLEVNADKTKYIIMSRDLRALSKYQDQTSVL